MRCCSVDRSLLAALVCVAGIGCAGEQAVRSTDDPGTRYATAFPSAGNEFDMEPVMPSIRMLSSVAFYRQASFVSDVGWPVERQITDGIWQAADTISTFTNSVVGTGTVLQFSMQRIALLTSAHVVTFKDTLTTYYYRDGERAGIRAFAVKMRQRNYVAEIPGADALEVLARDDRLDVAIIGQTIRTRDTIQPTFPLRTGDAGDLDWGSFVYVIGFPVGLRMVSAGIVSQPMRDSDGSFLTNVVFNRGMSGAAVLAAKPGESALEWVGIITSGSASTELTLSPGEQDVYDESVAEEPYEGEIFVSKIQRIRYGITMAVSVNALRKFASDHEDALRRRGFRLSLLD